MSAEKNYLRSYLRVSPAALAVWRAIEAKHLATVELPRPLLDLGCGFGEFASVVFDDPVDIGLDIRLKDLKMANSSRMYKSLTQADARRMPFAGGSLASVMSLSVLEHIPRIEDAVAETSRVLRMGGTFAFTAPTDKLNEMLFYSRAFNKIGLAPLGRGYAWLYNKAVSHQSLLSEDEWLRMLERVGFDIERREMIIGRRALKAFDLTLPLAVPAQASRLLFGVRGVRRPDFIVDFWEKRLSSFVDEDTDEGSNVFIVARKR